MGMAHYDVDLAMQREEGSELAADTDPDGQHQVVGMRFYHLLLVSPDCSMCLDEGCPAAGIAIAEHPWCRP